MNVAIWAGSRSEPRTSATASPAAPMIASVSVIGPTYQLIHRTECSA